MNDEFAAFITAVQERLSAQHFEFDTVIAVGCDPDDEGVRAELHVFDVPETIRRDVETRVIDILLDIEDLVPHVASLAFVHPPTLGTAARAAIEGHAAVRHIPTLR